MSATGTHGLRLERSFAAAPEEVFDAWTAPDVLARWCGPGGYDSPGCDVDLRVGGRYTLRMRDPSSGRVHVVNGEYREIERPRRLVYTWCWDPAGVIFPGVESLVSVEFTASGGGTLVTLEHDGLPTEASLAPHRDGWEESLQKLTLYLETNQPQEDR